MGALRKEINCRVIKPIIQLLEDEGVALDDLISNISEQDKRFVLSQVTPNQIKRGIRESYSDKDIIEKVDEFVSSPDLYSQTRDELSNLVLLESLKQNHVWISYDLSEQLTEKSKCLTRDRENYFRNLIYKSFHNIDTLLEGLLKSKSSYLFDSPKIIYELMPWLTPLLFSSEVVKVRKTNGGKNYTQLTYSWNREPYQNTNEYILEALSQAPILYVKLPKPEIRVTYGDKFNVYDITWVDRKPVSKKPILFGLLGGGIISLGYAALKHFNLDFPSDAISLASPAAVGTSIGTSWYLLNKLGRERGDHSVEREENVKLQQIAEKRYYDLENFASELQQAQSELVRKSSKELLYDAGLSYSLFGQAFGKGDIVGARGHVVKVMRLLKEYLDVHRIVGSVNGVSVPSVELGLAAAELSYSQMEPQSFSLLRKAEERKVGGNLSFYRKGEGGAEGKFVKQFKLVPSAVSDIEFLLWNMQNPDFRKELKTPLVLASDFYSVVEGGEKREAAFVLEEEIVGSSLFDFVNKLNTRSGDDYSVLLKDRLVNKCLRSVAFFESEYERNDDLRNLVGVLRDHSKPEVVRYDDKLFDVFQNYLNIDFGSLDSGVVDKLRFSFSQIHDALSKHSASPCLDFSPRNVRVGLKHAYLNLRAKQGATVDSCLEELGRVGNLDDFVLDYVSSGVGKGFSASDVLHAFEDSLYFVDFEKLASTTTSNDEVIHIVESPVYAFGDSVKKGKDVLYLAYLKNFLDGGKHAQQVSALEKGEVVDTGFLSGFDHNGFVASRDLMSFYRNMRWVKWLKGLLHEEQYCSFHLGEACNSLDKEVSKASSAGITLDSRLEDLAGSGSGLEFTKCFLDKYVGDKFL